MGKKICVVIATVLVVSGSGYDISVADIPVAERNALIALYNSTSGASWTDNTGWLGAPGTECAWYGVTCDAGETYVANLLLSDNNLSGSIPPELGNLPDCWWLSLGTNQLTGSIPSQIGNMSSLSWLWLDTNQLTGSIPSELGNLSNLSWLWLYNNQLTGSIPPQLGNITSLSWLSLYDNQLTGSIPSQLGTLTNLERLFLYENQLSSSIPPELGDLTSLTSLNISNNQLTGTIPSDLGDLPNLTGLSIAGNQLEGPVPTQLTSITTLADGGSDFRWNSLYTSDPGLRTFLDSKQEGGDWEGTQTVAPTNLTAATPASVALSWTAIAYTGDTGGYEVYYSPTSGGPYTLFETTADKTVESTVVTGLTPETTYYFCLCTVTNPHPNNSNTVYSKLTGEVDATIAAEETGTDTQDLDGDGIGDGDGGGGCFIDTAASSLSW